MGEITSLVDIRQTTVSSEPPEINEMTVAYQVPYGNSDPIEIRSTAVFGSRQDLLSLAFFKDILEMDVAYEVPIGFADPFEVLATANIKFRKDLVGRIYIKDTLEMDVQERVIQAPIEIIDARTLQDSYNRLARPTLNYGTSTTLLTGQPAEGKCYTIIDFDLTPLRNALINPKYRVRDIELILTYWGAMYGTISVYENLTTWYEYSVNWNSNIQKGAHLFDIPLNGEEVSITGIYDLIMDKMNKGINKLWIVLESPDYILIRSRETDSPPTIRMQYFDKTWQAYSDQYKFNSTVHIRAKRNRDFISRANLVRYVDLHSRSKFVPSKKDLPAHVLVRSNNMIEPLYSIAKFVPIPKDLPSIVELKETLDLDATFSSVSSYIKSTVEIKQIDDLLSTIKILSDIEDNPLYSTAYITLVSLPSTVQVALMEFLNASVDFVISDRNPLNSVVKLEKAKKDLYATAIISGAKESELHAIVSLVPAYIKATVSILGIEALEAIGVLGYQPALLPSTALFETSDKDLLNATVNILNYPKRELDATVDITEVKTYKGTKDLNARARLSKYVPDQIPGTVDITALGHNLYATAKITHDDGNRILSRANILGLGKSLKATARITHTVDDWKDLKAHAVFWQYVPGEFLGIAKISQNDETDLQFGANIFSIKDLKALATLRQSGNNNLGGEGIIRQNGDKNLDATVDMLRHENLHSLAVIRQYAEKNLKAMAKIRQNGDRELNAIAQIYQWKDLNMRAEVWYYKRLYATAKIRQFDVYEVNGTVNFMNSSLFYTNLFQTTIIRQTVREKFDALVKLVNDGVRYWVPDKHAPEIFGPEDDFKLPRRWKKEDFI